MLAETNHSRRLHHFIFGSTRAGYITLHQYNFFWVFLVSLSRLLVCNGNRLGVGVRRDTEPCLYVSIGTILAFMEIKGWRGRLCVFSPRGAFSFCCTICPARLATRWMKSKWKKPRRTTADIYWRFGAWTLHYLSFPQGRLLILLVFLQICIVSNASRGVV